MLWEGTNIWCEKQDEGKEVTTCLFLIVFHSSTRSRKRLVFITNIKRCPKSFWRVNIEIFYSPLGALKGTMIIFALHSKPSMDPWIQKHVKPAKLSGQCFLQDCAKDKVSQQWQYKKVRNKIKKYMLALFNRYHALYSIVSNFRNKWSLQMKYDC